MAGEAGIRGAGWGVEDMAAETPGWWRGVEPRSREAVRLFPQGFTRDDSPGEDGWGLGIWVELEIWRVVEREVKSRI
jgi:hypothetical protein